MRHVALRMCRAKKPGGARVATHATHVTHVCDILIYMSDMSDMSAALRRLAFLPDMCPRHMSDMSATPSTRRRIIRANKKYHMHLLNLLMCYNPCTALLIRISTSPAHVLHVQNTLHAPRALVPSVIARSEATKQSTVQSLSCSVPIPEGVPQGGTAVPP